MKTAMRILSVLAFALMFNLATAQSQPTVGLVMKSLGNEFFKQMQEGAVQHVTKRGDLKLVPLGIQNETDVEAQIGLVENLIAQKVKAIVIAPADSRALVPVLARAVGQGIVVVNIDVRLDVAALASSKVDIPYVGPDNAQAAKQVGDVLAKKLGKGAKIIVLEGVQGADNAVQRANGFKQAAKDGGLNIVATQTANWETDQAFTVVTNLLTANKDVTGVMCSNDSMAIGAVRAIDALKLTGKVQVVGFDNIPAVAPLLKNGTLLATLDQFGAQQASNGIDIAMDMLKGKKYSGWVRTPVKLIQAADIK